MKKLLVLGMLLSSLVLAEWKTYHPLNNVGAEIRNSLAIEVIAQDGTSKLKIEPFKEIEEARVNGIRIELFALIGEIFFSIEYNDSNLDEEVIKMPSQFIRLKIDDNEPITITYYRRSSGVVCFKTIKLDESGEKIILDPNIKLLLAQMKKGKELKIIPEDWKLLVFSLENFEEVFTNFFEINEKNHFGYENDLNFFYLYKTGTQE